MGYIIRLSLANIKVRKLRTTLTILGIMIGIMSIVTMLATGLGAKKAMLEEVEKAGNTREIQVLSENSSRKDRLLTDTIVQKISKLDNVTGVYPVLEAQGDEKLSGYIGYNSISGVPAEYLELLTVKEGEFPSPNGSRPELLADEGVRYTLYNKANWQILADSTKKDDPLTGKRIDFQLMGLDDLQQLSIEENEEDTAADVGKDSAKEKADSVADSSVSDSSGDGTFEDDMEPSNNYQKLRIVGETDNKYGTSLYTDIDTLKLYLKRQKVDGRIPGQPLDKNNRPYQTWVYSSIIVRTDSVDNVEKVSKSIQSMGFKVYNNLEALQSVTKTINMLQFILGAIGCISGIVAIIGIINTMMTAVYDRVREIGLLKMLGSDSDDISFMFIFESGLMGFVGGILGIGLSFLADIVINKKLVAFMKMPEETWIMSTPAWLILGAVVLSVFISVLAGAFPARWASKIKPLDAMAR